LLPHPGYRVQFVQYSNTNFINAAHFSLDVRRYGVSSWLMPALCSAFAFFFSCIPRFLFE